MRELTDHKANLLNSELMVAAVDEPGSGGANHLYVAVGPEPMQALTVRFQNGPIAEVGINGVTHEVLLAIVADRLRGFQQGPYACRDNALALQHVEGALLWLQKRTRERMARGVEGTSAA